MSEKKITLGAVELELMKILWRIGEGTVREVMGELKSSRAYTSVSTMLRLLEKKKYVASHKEGKNHRYYPTLTQEDYQTSFVKSMVKDVFYGTPKILVNTLIASEQVDLDELSSLVDELRRESER